MAMYAQLDEATLAALTLPDLAGMLIRTREIERQRSQDLAKAVAVGTAAGRNPGASSTILDSYKG